MAASPDAWAAPEAAFAETCVVASELAKARTPPAVDFELYRVTRISCQNAFGRMKETPEAVLCLWDRETRGGDLTRPSGRSLVNRSALRRLTGVC